ncbi:glycosyl transferase [Aphanothece hegewaldii CCALA 016]|uniref:4,4'-diaponeurosporenoate glycosyltransferase n=1 Tax=Aphanothece hegewaldii CCALA 016 TaxID=2107694 RepID=A0A2T1M2V5_9CHRO|nr:glycosyltransferase family 2 protein [Aphanothece hegewaldii]PSF39090.1 glycosyl transferase [Aphanothece hegewaldii CCALA 016]
MSISVIIPVHKGGEAFQHCLSSLKQFASAETEIIVVADGDEESGDLAESFGAKVIRNSSASGPAKARNKGAKIATGDVLFFIDADVTVNANTIPQVNLLFLKEPELAAAIGSYDDEPGASNFLSQYKNLFHHYTHQTGSEEASTFWGACGAIRRDIFLKIGGFDESYRLPCVEDIELGYRLKIAGYSIKLCKTIQVKHLKRWDVISLLRADFFYRALPWTNLILRHRQLKNDLNLQWSSRISVILVYSLLVSFLAALWWSYLWLLVLGIMVTLFIINFSVYRFFYHQRGIIFTIRMIPWHWLYFFYSGLAFAIGMIRYYGSYPIIKTNLAD